MSSSNDASPLETALVRRMNAALLRVSDEDAVTWLNGQITQQVATLAVGDPGRYGLFVDVHGKILADAWVHRREAHIDVIVPAARAESLFAHLDRYIVMEDVELTLHPELSIVTAQGPRASELPTPEGAVALSADRLGLGGVDFVTADEAGALESLGAAARAIGGGPVDDESWHRARVLRGVPEYGIDFGEDHLPQEAGLGARAVSFQKGCYLGQEVVCMLEMRGKPRRRLCRLESDAPLAVGAALTSDKGEVGAITSVVSVGDATRALGYVKRRAIEKAEPLHADGVEVRLLDVIG